MTPSISLRSAASLVIASALFAPPAFAGFFGPSMAPLLPDALLQRLQTQPVLFSASGKDLEVRTKGAAIAGFLVGALLSNGLANSGSGGQPISAQQLNQNMEISRQFVAQATPAIQNAIENGAASDAAKDWEEIARRGPMVPVAAYLDKSLRGRRVRLDDGKAEAKPTLNVSLQQVDWRLEYSLLSSDYTLFGTLSLEVLDKEADKLLLSKACGGEFPKKMPLDDWQRDGHKALAQAVEDIARRCRDEFSQALNFVTVVDSSPTRPPEPSESPATGSGSEKPTEPAADPHATEVSTSDIAASEAAVAGKTAPGPTAGKGATAPDDKAALAN